MSLTEIKAKLRGFSPQANYTDRATAAVGTENYCRGNPLR
jgi:hypothetical protein